MIVHRVVDIAIINDSTRYYTKGDANDAGDGSTVHYKNIIGSPVFSIPYLGYVADYIQNPPGTYITIAFCVVLLAAVFLPDLLFKDEENQEESK